MVVVVVLGAVDGMIGCEAAGVARLSLPEHTERPTPTMSDSATIRGRPAIGPGYPAAPTRRPPRPANLAGVSEDPGAGVSEARAETLVALLDQRAGDDTAGIVVDDRSWTWREVVAESARWSAALATLRPARDPFHVGVLLGNRPEYLFALFGAARVGAVLVGVNETRRGDELARDIRHTDCVAVLTDTDHVGLLDGLDLGDTTVVDVDGAAWRDLVATAPEPATEPVATNDVLLLIFTSGSTGAPKAVQLSHARACRVANAASWFGRDDVLYCAMPLFHGNALNAIVFPALATGATIALRERFSATRFMPDVRRLRRDVLQHGGSRARVRPRHAGVGRRPRPPGEVRARTGVVAA